MTAGPDVEREASLGLARDDLERAVAAGVLRADQADALWRFLRVKAGPGRRSGRASTSSTCCGTPAR
jgi:hypothetical protein